ncbi:MAG TPA: thioredoxin [Thermomicrobiaceae bacterium]|nr:thioredoxin [Thermomicrobiaceae bacterium]
MPAVIDPNVCDRHFAGCFPARMCPQHAFSFDDARGLVVIDSDLCGDCPGPCMNFCDRYAIRFAADPTEFEVLRDKTFGILSEVDAAEELKRRKEEREAAEKAAAPEPAVVAATDATFDEVVLKSDLPVMVDFWATWCGPCKAMAPVFEALAEQYRELIRFVKVDVDASPKLSARYRVQSIPTLAFFWQGQLVDAFAGALPEAELQSVAYEFLAAVRQLEQARTGTPQPDPLG